MYKIKSVNNVTIRFNGERWFHIIENHEDLAGYSDEIADTVEFPDVIIEGYSRALIALRLMDADKYLCVVYKEIDADDGFVITAYFSSKIKLEKEKIIWRRTN